MEAQRVYAKYVHDTLIKKWQEWLDLKMHAMLCVVGHQMDKHTHR